MCCVLAEKRAIEKRRHVSLKMACSLFRVGFQCADKSFKTYL